MYAEGALFFLRQLHDFTEFFHHVVITSPLVWHQAAGTILHARIGVLKIAATVFTQSVKRTVTKQAIEIFLILCLVAWEKLALPMLKKLIIL